MNIVTARLRMFIRRSLMCLSIVALFGCRSHPVKNEHSAARDAFLRHCATSGEFIYETVENVDGLFLMKLPNREINFGDQFMLDDPYGSDVTGEGYIGTFLRESYDLLLLDKFFRQDAIRIHDGFAFVDAVDPADGIRYRYTGRIDEPFQKNKNYLEGYFRTVIERVKAEGPAPRYGVTYDDISTTEDRKLWIAGSSLRVIDLKTNKVMGERIGYMYDPGQGSRAGGREPWLLATRTACPAFGKQQHSVAQLHQTIRFVEKVLHSDKG